MLNNWLHYLVSPITHMPLQRDANVLYTSDKVEKYNVVNDIPILLTEDTAASWHREIMEVLLWQYPEEIDEMYSKIDWIISPTMIYIEYIKKLLKDKNGILSAVRAYSNTISDKWIVRKNREEIIPSDEIAVFERRNSEQFASATVARARNNETNDGWAVHKSEYVMQVHASKPSTIVEISTGSGSGTAAVAVQKERECVMFTIDIGYGCHGNSVSIADYLNINNTLCPVCANFWHLPFPNESVDVVCSHFGLDESREINLTISEISRILKKGGRFVNVSRKNVLSRSYDLFEPFGFKENEMVEIIKAVRLYSDTDDLVVKCTKQGLLLDKKTDFRSSVERVREICVTTFTQH